MGYKATVKFSNNNWSNNGKEKKKNFNIHFCRHISIFINEMIVLLARKLRNLCDLSNLYIIMIDSIISKCLFYVACMFYIKCISCMLDASSNNMSRIYRVLVDKNDRSLATCHPPILDDSRRNTEAIARNVRRINVAVAFYFYAIIRRSKVSPVVLFIL